MIVIFHPLLHVCEILSLYIKIANLILAVKYYIDTTFLHTPRPSMELHGYMKDGMIENWDLFEKILDYSYDKVNSN